MNRQNKELILKIPRDFVVWYWRTLLVLRFSFLLSPEYLQIKFSLILQVIFMTQNGATLVKVHSAGYPNNIWKYNNFISGELLA